MGKNLLVDHNGRPLARTSPTAQELTIAEFNAVYKEQGLAGGGYGDAMRTVAWYYACLTQTARAFAQMPLKIWQRASGRRGSKPGYRQIYGHPLQDLLDRPHPAMSSILWREKWASILLDGGDVFCIPDAMPNPDGIPRALTLYGRDKVRPIRQMFNGPLMGWMLRLPGQEPKPYGLDQVMHWALPNPHDDVMGQAPKDALRMQLDADFYRLVYDKTFYQNSGQPSAVLQNKNQELDDVQRQEVRDSYNEMHQGPGRAGKLLIIGMDWEFKQWALQQSQAQYIESRKLGREEIAAAFFGFPVGFLNAQENGGLSRAGEEADRLKFFENCIFPLSRTFEPEFNWGFVRRIDPTLEVSFDTRGVPVALIYANTEASILKSYVSSGIATNDVIESLDLPFDPQPGGDVPLVPNTLIPLEDVGSVALAAPAASPVAADGADPAAEPASPTKHVALPAPRPMLEADPMIAVTMRLRRKLKRALYAIRQTALRDPNRATSGATAAERRTWGRHVMPSIAIAVQGGAEPESLKGITYAEIEHTLEALQARAETISFGHDARDAACADNAARLVNFLDETLRDAARDEAPERYLASLDRAAALMADGAIKDAMAAGAATALEAA